MRNILNKREEIAVLIYCAKVMGFYANPTSETPLMEPAIGPCIEDADFLLQSLENAALRRLRPTLEATSNERQAG